MIRPGTEARFNGADHEQGDAEFVRSSGDDITGIDLRDMDTVVGDKDATGISPTASRRVR